MRENPPEFHPVDPAGWPRKPYFDHYYHAVRCTHSTTATVGAGSLLAACRARKIKFYPAMIHIIASAVNGIEEMRTCRNADGELGVWNFMSPLYAVFHAGTKTFSNIWTTYDGDFSRFHKRYLDDAAAYGDRPEFFPKPSMPDNTFPVSCLPWVAFSAFNLNVFSDGDYLRPIVTIGRFSEADGDALVPVALQAHHALCDGYHVGAFFEKVSALAESAEHWIDGRVPDAVRKDEPW